MSHQELVEKLESLGFKKTKIPTGAVLYREIAPKGMGYIEIVVIDKSKIISVDIAVRNGGSFGYMRRMFLEYEGNFVESVVDSIRNQLQDELEVFVSILKPLAKGFKTSVPNLTVAQKRQTRRKGI